MPVLGKIKSQNMLPIHNKIFHRNKQVTTTYIFINFQVVIQISYQSQSCFPCTHIYEYLTTCIEIEETNLSL